ncbi:MAG: excinuclease ABC subunit UvrA, partial [Thermodesulfobacteria bacterium]|nr:excinuclease ABC subunit UvrA [Thermodesulfobacteriota bacterium]
LLRQDTPTGRALREVNQPKKFEPLAPAEGAFLEVIGAEENNLQGIDVRFPLRGLSVITGVSGSGKSTLLELILYRGLKRLKGESTDPPGRFREIRGHEAVRKVVLLDQSPLAKSPRANPATYLKVYDGLRKLLAATPEAKEAGLSASAFSFNSSVGQCPHCQGLGFEVVEMQFLSDLHFPCPVCKGRRFREEVLSVRWHGKNVADFLELTFEEARDFFSLDRASSSKEEKILREIREKLRAAMQVGLGYLRLGQPLSTLSGGEAQRLKIAHHLFLEKGAETIFLLDEPTVGLHLVDVERLMAALKALVEQGNAVIVVEHHPEMMRRASWIVDLGPEGGEEGGRLLYQGPPEGLLDVSSSHTGHWLKRYLEGRFI